MRDVDPDVASRVLRHLAEIGAGRCSIDDERLVTEPSTSMRELLAGLLTLHEDLQHERALRAVAERKQDKLVEELKAAVAARDEFLSVASHELRTPISTLRLQVTGLTRWKGSGEEREAATDRRLQVIDRQVVRLEGLIAQLLDVTRLTAGRLELHREHMDLVVLAREVIERYAADSSRTSISLTCVPAVLGEWDPFRLDQVVTNLVANALRYGASKPVRVDVTSEGDAACLVVSDEGIGISADQKHRIFNQFARAVSSENYGGLGLGLWIVRQIVDAHGGTIDVDSEPGRGSKFTVRLPRRAEPSAGAAP